MEGGETLRISEQYTQHGQELGIGMKIGGLTENLHMEWFDFSKPFLPRFLHRTLVAFQTEILCLLPLCLYTERMNREARQSSLLENPSRS